MPHSPPVPGTARVLACIGRCLADRNRCAVPVPHGGPWLNQPGQPPEPPEAAKNPEMTRITHKASKTRASPRRVSRFTSHVSPSPSVLSVPSVVKNLCDFASLRLCVKALSHSCVSCLSWLKSFGPAATIATSCNFLQLTAIYCGYLRPIATISPYFPLLPPISHRNFFPHDLATLPSAWSWPPSAPGPQDPVTFHVSPSPFVCFVYFVVKISAFQLLPQIREIREIGG
jgi:hypothetical protein